MKRQLLDAASFASVKFHGKLRVFDCCAFAAKFGYEFLFGRQIWGQQL
ncbi:MAG: hypothetical protein IKO55_12655 [Kiritimatiellae bacterium]|nr:hypothetical protein [Kiritimatiellia bacterium]